MKKFFSAVLVVVMTISLLAGCGSQEATPTETDPTVSASIPAGTLVLCSGTCVSITYDTDGLVLKVNGVNEAGIELADSYTDYMGKPCATVAKELIAAGAQAGQLTPDVKNIIIKQNLRSQLPDSHFLETIETEVKAAAEAAGSTAVITVIDTSKLDEQGYINLDTAKALLCNELGVEKLDKYYGSATPIDGTYLCTAEVAGVQTSHVIDADTGLIADATEEDLLGNPDVEEETTMDPEETYEEEIVEEIFDAEA